MYQKNSDSAVIKKSFTAGQAAKAAGISYPQIDRWAKSGLVVPSVQIASGPDTCRVYNFQDLVALRVAAKLRAAGIKSRDLAKVVEYLRSLNYNNSLAGPYLLVAHDGDVLLVKEKGLVSALKSPGQLYFVFALGDAVNELKVMAKAFERPARGKARMAVA